jgi:hypothetical protein
VLTGPISAVSAGQYIVGLFTKVVAIAERHGRSVRLLVVPSSNVFDAVAQTAVRLSSSEIVLGDSAKFEAGDQARLLGAAWERVEGSDRLRTRLLAYKRSGEVETYQLGPHAPTLTTEDLDLIHKLWLQAVNSVGLDLHHRDIVRVALEELRDDMSGERHTEAIERIRRRVARALAGGDSQAHPPGSRVAPFADDPADPCRPRDPAA